MTHVFSLTGVVNMRAAYELLPITRVTVEPSKRARKKCKLPLGPLGAIIRLQYGDLIRGIIRSTTKRKWKNGVIIDLSTSSKNISLKLSSRTIHSAGSSSVQNGQEGADLLIKHLFRVQGLLDEMHRDKEARDRVLNWLSEVVPDEPLLRPYVTILDGTPATHLVEWKVDFGIKRPESIPIGINESFASFFLQFLDDYSYFNDYWHKVQQIITLECLITPDLSLGPIQIKMANYNYRLGYRIDRLKLALYFHQRNGFLAQYNNTAGHRVRIIYPLEPESSHPDISKSKKTKPKRHTFMITMSGSVTQSGPGEMNHVYHLFHQTFNEILPFVTR